MSFTSYSRNNNIIQYSNTSFRTGPECSKALSKSSSMKSIPKPLYQGMILKLYHNPKQKSNIAKKPKTRNISCNIYNNSNNSNLSGIYNLSNGSYLHNNSQYNQSNTTKNLNCSFHIPNFAKILLNQKQNINSRKKNINNYYNNVNKSKDHQILSASNKDKLLIKNKTQNFKYTKKITSKTLIEINEELNQPIYSNITNKKINTSRLKENKNHNNCISLKRKNNSQISNGNNSFFQTHSRNATSSKSPHKKTTMTFSGDFSIKQNGKNTTITNSDCSVINGLNNEDKGPEEFHFTLVKILNRQKQTMINLSKKLEISNDGIEVSYLD